MKKFLILFFLSSMPIIIKPMDVRRVERLMELENTSRQLMAELAQNKLQDRELVSHQLNLIFSGTSITDPEIRALERQHNNLMTQRKNIFDSLDAIKAEIQAFQ